MKVLDAGTEPMSNLDVINWIKDKREQHEKEDAEDKAKGIKPTERPKNFLASLNKHESELTSNKYPYTNNPSAYGPQPSGDPYEPMKKFDMLMAERICIPMEEPYRGKGYTEEELENTLGKEQEEKELTETEHLMILNHAPQNVEMLQSMIENIDDRFTAAEQQIIVDCVMEVYRADEKDKPKVEITPVTIGERFHGKRSEASLGPSPTPFPPGWYSGLVGEATATGGNVEPLRKPHRLE